MDNSMEPLFPLGTILVMDEEASPAFGNFVLVGTEGAEERFGQIVCENGKACLKPANPNYPAIPLEENTSFGGVVRQAIIDVD